jgi:aprataxin
MSFLTVLRTYAQTAPESLPASILFKHSDTNITVFDAYPKAIFHFLVLPRLKPECDLNATALHDLQSLLKADKTKAKKVIASLAEDAKGVKEDIQNEMVKRFGFKWDVWMGFHAVPSMA